MAASRYARRSLGLEIVGRRELVLIEFMVDVHRRSSQSHNSTRQGLIELPVARLLIGRDDPEFNRLVK